MVNIKEIFFFFLICNNKIYYSKKTHEKMKECYHKIKTKNI